VPDLFCLWKATQNSKNVFVSFVSGEVYITLSFVGGHTGQATLFFFLVLFITFPPV